MRLTLPLALTLSLAAARADDPARVDVDLGRLPRLWRVARRVEATADQRAAFGQRLGVPLSRVENVHYDAAGPRLQVNVITCADEADAARLVDTLARAGKPAEAIGRRGATVVELVGGGRQVQLAARAALGLDPRPEEVRWSVSLIVTPLRAVDPDATAWNRLFNLLAASGRGDAQAGEQARRLAAGFRVADALEAPPLTVRPLEPALDLPRLAVEGQVVVTPFAGRPAAAPGGALVAATPRWPVDDATIREQASALLAGDPPARERVERALGWVRAHVRYDGDTGSRWGTLRVVEQGFGHCWDHADVLITLCRAMGVPARQVYGWLAGVSGHVWAEVFVDGAWWPVDATASWIGTSGDHVPLFTSETGEIPVVYWGAPDLRR